MVRKETAMRLPPQHQGLEVKIPSFFRCPISLDVMRSPVSLCTGVTYDRASIQRWLDSGNTTCPATMLPLPSTDLVPNLTLRSLIAHWAAASASCSPTAAAGSADSTGRAALCQDAEDAVPAVIGKMMKAGRGGAEAAVAVLWAVCHRYRDRRAVDAAAAADGGLTKLLLLMQSGCSPAARQMALELLKIYKVNAKSCLAGYDSKTTHIMPF
ncbi:hypothetical protein EJB05_52786, partial [Eragrostis curvula]